MFNPHLSCNGSTTIVQMSPEWVSPFLRICITLVGKLTEVILKKHLLCYGSTIVKVNPFPRNLNTLGGKLTEICVKTHLLCNGSNIVKVSPYPRICIIAHRRWAHRHLRCRLVGKLTKIKWNKTSLMLLIEHLFQMS